MRESEVWFRNPHNYIRELLEADGRLIAWDRGMVVKRRIDPVPFVEMHYGSLPFRSLMVGDQGTAEIGPGRTLENPIAVYPTWVYGDPTEELVNLIQNPVGQDPSICLDMRIPVDERPVLGQEHRVVVSEIPPMSTGIGKRFIAWLKELQEDNPDCIIHVHGFYSFKAAFGMGFGAGDMDPRTAAANKKLQMASGNEMPYQKVQANARWVTVLGMTPGDLESPAKRCIFNIRSAKLYAKQAPAQANLLLRARSGRLVDTETPDADYVPPTTKNALPARIPVQEGDKMVCNSCSLQLSCKQFRVGEVCSLPESSAARLAHFFKTRDSAKIIDGLGVLMAMGANRLEQKAGEENAIGEIDPEVTKMINSLFVQGMQLAKLVDPSLRSSGVKVNVGVINGQASATVSSGKTPAELTGEVVRALEAQGIPRDQITPQLVMSTLQGMGDQDRVQQAIEGTIIDSKD